MQYQALRHRLKSARIVTETVWALRTETAPNQQQMNTGEQMPSRDYHWGLTF